MLFTNAAFIFFMLLLFAACGWWSLAPFRRYVPFPLAVSVLAGMILLACTALMTQVVLQWSFSRSLYAAIALLVAGSALSIAVHGFKEIVRDAPVVLGLALGLAIVATVFITRADLANGEPSLGYIGGTDQLGYTHLADWLRLYGTQTGLDIPPETGAYESWPDLMLKTDPRFGSFSLVALISVLSGRSGAFTYDLACAIIVAAGAIGLAGLFARRRWSLALCAAAILVSPLFEFAITGHLGKVDGFPSALMVTGLYFNLARMDLDEDVHNFALLASIGALTASAALMFSGYVTAIALGCFGTSYLLLQLLADRKQLKEEVRLYARPAAILASLLVLAVLAYGVVSRPLYIGYVVTETPWQDMWQWTTGVSGLVPGVSDLPWGLPGPAALLLTLMALGIGVMAVRTKRPEAGALILGVVLFVTYLVLRDDRWRYSQTIPLYVTAVLCAAAALGGSLKFREWSIPSPLGGAVLALCLAFGTYRAFPVADQVAGGSGTNQTYVFAESEVAGLANAIKKGGYALIDVPALTQLNLVLITELTPRGAPWALSEGSWKAALGYRTWKYPGAPPTTNLRVVLKSDANNGKPNLLYRTRQYDLLGPEPAAAPR